MAERAAHLHLISPSASPEETAAIVAAIERFMRATAPAPVAAEERPDPWTRAAILEGAMHEDRSLSSAWGGLDPSGWTAIGRKPRSGVPVAWINT
jgi:hypothetical protein